jgi:uncharacterized damage-inducible protein DinB
MANEALLKEFDAEMKTTRRVLERVPDGKPDWKPHPKSFSLAHLAQLVSWMPGWFAQAIENDTLDLSGGPKYSNEKSSTLLADFDRNVAAGRKAIAAATSETWKANWSLVAGGKTIMTLPKDEVTRQNMSHLVHHRAQLGVYLRLLDVPVPSMYGPTADERW